MQTDSQQRNNQFTAMLKPNTILRGHRFEPLFRLVDAERYVPLRPSYPDGQRSLHLRVLVTLYLHCPCSPRNLRDYIDVVIHRVNARRLLYTAHTALTVAEVADNRCLD